MAFTSRRGRPPALRPTCADDPGTPELRLKHALGLTAEPLDMCLSKQLITPLQHRCGLHLRWLHTIRYGAPSLTTRYELHGPVAPRSTDDPQWRHQRESEYQTALAALYPGRYDTPVLRLCIDNQRPSFLTPSLLAEAIHNPHLAQLLTDARCKLTHGLDLLAAHWRWR